LDTVFPGAGRAISPGLGYFLGKGRYLMSWNLNMTKEAASEIETQTAAAM
jgi:hypothetical protein